MPIFDGLMATLLVTVAMAIPRVAAQLVPPDAPSELQPADALQSCSQGNLSWALAMWIVGVSNQDQALCGAKQWARFAPAAWMLVFVHRSDAPELVDTLSDELGGRKHRFLDIPSLQQRIHERSSPSRSLLYKRSELAIVALKILTWTLVEYDRVLLVDTDIFISRHPFSWLSCPIMEYTEDPEVVVATRACQSKFNSGFVFFKPNMTVAKHLVERSRWNLKRSCEMLKSDQTILNNATPHWLAINVITHLHYNERSGAQGAYRQMEDHPHPIVHFVGPNKPYSWFRSCARNWTAMVVGPESSPKPLKAHTHASAQI